MLPFVPVGLACSAFRKAFYAWHFDCTFSASDDPVPARPLMRLDFIG